MLTLENLEIELRRRAVRCAIPTHAREALRSLEVEGEPHRSAAALVRYLDETPMYTAARDRVLAVLLQTMKPGPEAPFGDLLMYAFVPSIRRLHCRVVAGAFVVDDEILPDTLVAVLDAITAYDPVRHSPHVQANVELNVLNAFHAKWNREKKTKAAEREVRTLAWCHGNERKVQAHPAWFFPGEQAAADASLSPEDKVIAEEILGCLARKGLLSRLDAKLVGDLCLQGITSTQLGREHSIDRRTVVRRVERACRRIRGDFEKVLQGENARFGSSATIYGQF